MKTINQSKITSIKRTDAVSFAMFFVVSLVTPAMGFVVSATAFIVSMYFLYDYISLEQELNHVS